MLIIIFFVYFLLIFVILINDTNYCHILQEYFITIKFYQKGKKQKKKRHCHSSDSSRKSLISLNLCCIHECEFSVTVNLSDNLFSFFNATIEIRFDRKLQCLQYKKVNKSSGKVFIIQNLKWMLLKS